MRSICTRFQLRCRQSDDMSTSSWFDDEDGNTLYFVFWILYFLERFWIRCRLSEDMSTHLFFIIRWGGWKYKINLWLGFEEQSSYHTKSLGTLALRLNFLGFVSLLYLYLFCIFISFTGCLPPICSLYRQYCICIFFWLVFVFVM